MRNPAMKKGQLRGTKLPFKVRKAVFSIAAAAQSGWSTQRGPAA